MSGNARAAAALAGFPVLQLGGRSDRSTPLRAYALPVQCPVLTPRMVLRRRVRAQALQHASAGEVRCCLRPPYAMSGRLIA
eukprot:3662506-Rhodomonas_salina.4